MEGRRWWEREREGAA
uniref:Uncharacterized protein n=1 Tax=Arundo donax TaxID=35708 RepID=A0A0A9EXK1_ARUDO